MDLQNDQRLEGGKEDVLGTTKIFFWVFFRSKIVFLLKVLRATVLSRKFTFSPPLSFCLENATLVRVFLGGSENQTFRVFLVVLANNTPRTNRRKKLDPRLIHPYCGWWQAWREQNMNVHKDTSNATLVLLLGGGAKTTTNNQGWKFDSINEEQSKKISSAGLAKNE